MGWGDVPNLINDTLRSLTAWLCKFIYPLIADLYNLLIELGSITYTDGFKVIYNKISLIIGIFMVFRITFWLIELLISPDGIKDKEKNPGNIIKKVVISVVLLATTPVIFETALDLQQKILEAEIIENIIGIGEKTDATDAGRFLSAELFINFYTLEPAAEGDDCARFTGTDMTGSGALIYRNLYTNGELTALSNSCLTDRMKADDTYKIDFNGLFAVGVGGFVLWMMLMYCIEVGARFVQLIYLQVIAPVPIMCYLVPGKDNMFTKWIKQCTTTYLDLFIRIAIINFVMLLSNLILNNDNNFILNFNNANWLIEVFLVLGLLTFAKKAPALISELIPMSSSKASGDFGLSFKKKTDNMLFGKPIGKAYDKAIGFLGNTAKGAALLPFTTGMRAMAGIDSMKQGKGFWNGIKKHPGKMGQWINKQYETLMPESYKAHQEQLEGRSNVREIDTKWKKGVAIARTLQEENPSGNWKKAFDGMSYGNYKKVFKNERFRQSKMAVDIASNNEEQLRYAQQQLSAGNKTATAYIINSKGEKKPITYTLEEMGKLAEDYDKAQKTLKGAETVHAEISKQYQDDAATEAYFKFIKNNEVNPANPSENHEEVGIGVASNTTQEQQVRSDDDMTPNYEDLLDYYTQQNKNNDDMTQNDGDLLDNNTQQNNNNDNMTPNYEDLLDYNTQQNNNNNGGSN